MIIRCWGARGSIPVSGKEYVKYGGDTTCIEIRTKDDEIIIIDAGTGLRKLGNRLLAEDRHEYNMILTHAHWDHLLGFPFFKPIYSKQTRINMFGCPFAQGSIKDMLTKSMSPPHFPVKLEDAGAEIEYYGACKDAFQVGSVKVTPIRLSHPNQGLGYKFVENKSCFVFLTDNELTFRHPGGLDFGDYVEFSRGADLLIHDSEYTEEEYRSTKGWGHSIYTDALRLALEARVKEFGLFHHDQERSDAEMDGIVEDCQRTVDNRKSSLECFAAYQGMEVRI